MSNYLSLKATPAEFLAVTGVTPAEFDKYLPEFTTAYRLLYPDKQRSSESSQRPADTSGLEALIRIEDKLLFVWMAHKVQAKQAILQSCFGFSGEQAEYWLERLLPAMQLTLYSLASTKLHPYCATFLQLLNANRARYLVIGSYAVAFHGYLRPILDLDVFISTEVDNALKLEQVLHNLGPGAESGIARYFQDPEKVIRIGQAPLAIGTPESIGRFVQFGTAPIRIEVMTSISAVSFEECYQDRVHGVIDNRPVQLIGLTQLKVNKEASLGEKHAIDLAQLVAR